MRCLLLLMLLAGLIGCDHASTEAVPPPVGAEETAASFYGTLEPFAAEAVYFVVTDRFVNGDPDNDHRDQGGDFPTFDIPLPECNGVTANIGYLGGDFRGLLDHADYIREMGFTAVWLTPIADNPDQAFSGGGEINCDSILTDQGKTGYHGYWAINFYRTDEHLVSPGLDFPELTAGLNQRGLKTVLDIVGNHGSPGWSMVEPQPGFGQLFDAEGRLLADHQNLPPEELDPKGNPMHAWFRTEPSLAELASFNPDNPEVVEYLIGAYLRWIEQGASAFRIDTMAYMPVSFWREVADRIRSEHPDFFMSGEVWVTDPVEMVPYTQPENGGFSLIDFPLQERLREVFEDPDSDYGLLADRLLLDHAELNVYQFVTFYDNHDMRRLDADDAGFINAHNFLFTARGIPAVYYGSESGFMRGRGEHAGNRNYFGEAGIEAARNHPIRQQLSRIAHVRQQSIALQRGVQVMLELQGHRAAFYRVYQHEDEHQIALVLLNKGPNPDTFEISEGLQPGHWQSALDETYLNVDEGQPITVAVDAHDVAVFLLDAPVTDSGLLRMLE